MALRRRLDAELVRRELVDSREKGRRLISEGSVTVNGAIAQKPASLVAPGDAVEVVARPRFVGRGGDKMLGALAAFGLDPSGLRCVDVGSSTGGFTDCLLQHGATSVAAVDVGTAQLHERLRRDSRVAVHEQTDVRSVEPGTLGAPFDLVVVDVSFIGLDRILDSLVALGGPKTDYLVLVKPQFEAGKAEADRGRGVIRDSEVWRNVLTRAVAAADRRALVVAGVAVSPITGGAGNVEFFVHLRAKTPDRGAVDDASTGGATPERLDEWIDIAIAAAEALGQ